jgi:hypothetical protein
LKRIRVFSRVKEEILAMALQQKAPPKKRYEAPKLQVYGDLTEMTKTGGMFGQRDMLPSNQMT